MGKNLRRRFCLEVRSGRAQLELLDTLMNQSNKSCQMTYYTHGVRGLMVAMIRQAVYDLKTGGKFRNQANHWIRRNDSDYLFSFMNICEILDYNPEALRAGIYFHVQREYRYRRTASRNLTPTREFLEELVDRVEEERDG